MTDRSAKDHYREGTDHQFETPEMRLGPWSSYSLMHDPKHLGFVLSRYKFCAKMLMGKKIIMEVGGGDGFGLPLIAEIAERVYVIDWDQRLLEGNARRLAHLTNVTYMHVDLNSASPGIQVDGAFMIDVIEHVEPSNEGPFMDNIFRCLAPGGVLIVGTPNLAASQYASARSQVQHINLKSMATLRQLMERYFVNVFMFGMNDEVLHTGYAPMCHYLWSIGAGLHSQGSGR
jgi:2-polyprenyl-3-methyl-5-hydroxy-6-metoxy-1,4-benzoquinol methylase